MKLTDEMIKFANDYLDCKIYARNVAYATKEDREDIKSFCLQRLVNRWQSYDSNKSKWTTYMVTVLKTALVDALRWHYIHRQRMPFETLDESLDAEYEDVDLYDLIDDLLEDSTSREVCKMRLDGMHELTIMSKLKITKERFEKALEELHNTLKKRRSYED